LKYCILKENAKTTITGRSHYKVTIPFSEGNGVSLSPGPYDSLGLMDIGAGRISDEEYQNGGKCQANLWEFMGK
jgi:hypothetical protein